MLNIYNLPNIFRFIEKNTIIFKFITIKANGRN